MSDVVGVSPFVVGHVVRTTNTAESAESTAMVPGLWSRVLGNEGLLAWADRVGDGLFGVYFDYESDQSGAYSLLVGVGADVIEDVPAGLACVRVGDEKRAAFRAEGQMQTAMVDAWGRVWSSSAKGALSRTFTTDVEVHHPDGSADILIAVS